MKHFRILFYLILALCIFGCKESKNWGYGPNHSLKMSFADTSYIFSRFPREDISFGYYADSLIYYFDDKGKKIYKDYVIISTKFDFHPYYMLSIGGIAEMSSQQNIKYLYIDWPTGTTDTLYADYYRTNDRPNSCSCLDPLRELKLNGRPFDVKTDYDINGIYIWDF